MMISLEQLGQYKKDLNHSLEEHIGVMHDVSWNFHVPFHEHYELSVEQQMWIVLDPLLDSWENEAKAFLEQSSKLKYKKIVPKLKGELKRRIQGGIRRSRKSMNTFPWMKKMSATLMEREFIRREQTITKEMNDLERNIRNCLASHRYMYRYILSSFH